jgi:hypothetical protein
VERLACVAPFAQMHCLDASGAMLARAPKRLPQETRARVTFEQADILTASFRPQQ